ncbi:peptidoglycan-recognition protein LE [Trichonephila inaurata madagascariensis]|uniref:Peptidoglycan-recognition protein LE n=1 Tax=Trichonephila inaurata madagascariensis TaxID=2747483 RepID=A0A8X7CDH9_9ARAC|nr:peptidoglycan-recognition protein LE [Trichonephila inaurata madagascariensis]
MIRIWAVCISFLTIGNVSEGIDKKVCDGVDFVSREEWRARRPVDTYPLPLPVSHVIILHTVFGACDNTPLCIRNVQFIQDYHMDEKGWWDIAYSFLIGGDGLVYIGVGFGNVGEFTINYNSIGIGIAFMGNFDIMTPTDQMMNATKNLINCGIKKVMYLKLKTIWATFEAFLCEVF